MNLKPVSVVISGGFSLFVCGKGGEGAAAEAAEGARAVCRSLFIHSFGAFSLLRVNFGESMGAQVAKNGAKEETAAEKANGQVINPQGGEGTEKKRERKKEKH